MQESIPRSTRAEVDYHSIRQNFRTLIQRGYLRWTEEHPIEALDDWPTDKPLPLEVAITLPLVIVDAEAEEALWEAFGISDKAPRTDDRIISLSPASSLSCPSHELKLVPDVCRSCRFLAGEVG